MGLENLEFVENPQAKPLSKVKFEFPLHIATFDLEITHSENFPFEEPEIECSFKEAFQYKWTNEDRLEIGISYVENWIFLVLYMTQILDL